VARGCDAAHDHPPVSAETAIKRATACTERMGENLGWTQRG
jgi:hypothetical protein